MLVVRVGGFCVTTRRPVPIAEQGHDDEENQRPEACRGTYPLHGLFRGIDGAARASGDGRSRGIAVRQDLGRKAARDHASWGETLHDRGKHVGKQRGSGGDGESGASRNYFDAVAADGLLERGTGYRARTYAADPGGNDIV